MSRPQISLASATALVVANMIGVGVFTTSGYALHDTGDRGLVMLAWLCGGVLALCGALCYGALALRLPQSGGEYEYLRATIHPVAGTAAGIVSMLAGFSAPIAAAALLLQVYLCRLLDIAEPQLPWFATAAILLAALLHSFRVALGARAQDLVVLGKLLLIAVFLLLGARHCGGKADLPPVTSPWLGFAASMPWIYLAYSGWNASSYIAGEVRDAERSVPRAMLRGTLLVSAMYLLLNAVFLWSTDASALEGKAEIAAVAALALLGKGGETLVMAIVLLALCTSITGMLMAGPRVYARMAATGALPAAFAGADGAPPRASIALQMALALLFVWLTPLRELLTYIGWTLSLSSAATVLGLVRLRGREGRARVPVPAWPLPPLLFVTAVLAFAGFSLWQSPLGGLLGLGTLALATLLAHLAHRRPGKLADRA